MDNPDPGTHYKETKWNEKKYLDKTLLKYQAKIHERQAVIPVAKAPSIPSKKLAQTAYTGFGMDQVGPAAYNPKVQQVKNKTMEVDFVTTKIPRKTFVPTEAQKVHPGPGVYDYEMIDHKQFNSTGQYSIFQSKVPNCKDTKIRNDKPGPGTYKTVHSIEAEAHRHNPQNADGQILP